MFHLTEFDESSKTLHFQEGNKSMWRCSGGRHICQANLFYLCFLPLFPRHQSISNDRTWNPHVSILWRHQPSMSAQGQGTRGDTEEPLCIFMQELSRMQSLFYIHSSRKEPSLHLEKKTFFPPSFYLWILIGLSGQLFHCLPRPQTSRF